MNFPYQTSLLSLCAVLTLSSCAATGSKTESIAIGAAIGCAAGSVIAVLTDNDPGGGCAVAALIGGIAGYVKARNAEIEEARSITSAASRVEGATASPIQTDQVSLVDTRNETTDTVAAFKSVSVDIPISQINTPEGQEAIRKLQNYARKMADERGETIDITTIVALSSESSAAKVTLEETIELAGKGNVRRVRVADPTLAPNVHRITIEAKNQALIEV
jgi:hypothetical protein